MRARLLPLWAALALVGAVALAAPAFPELSGRVVDEAGLLDAATRAELTRLLAEHEQATSNQVVVVTLASLQGYSIEDYGYQLGRQWGIGQAGRDNGALLIVAPAERKVRIEVGYGLEGTLTDALSSNIIQTIILPRFRQDDYRGGVVEGTRAILRVIEGTYEPLAQTSERKNERGSEFMFFFILLLAAGQFLQRLTRSAAVSSGVLAGGAVLIGWLVLGSLVLGVIMALLIAVFHNFIGGAGGDGWRRGGHYPGGFGGGYGGGGFGGAGGGFSGGGGGFSGGGGSFGGGGSSGGW
jgi:uncharacterized protein